MANVPANAKKPEDHKAAKEEASDGPVEVEYEGEKWSVDRAAFDDVELFEAIEDEKYLQVVKNLLGREQWGRFKDSIRDDETGRVPMTAFEPFLNVLMGALGQGN